MRSHYSILAAMMLGACTYSLGPPMPQQPEFTPAPPVQEAASPYAGLTDEQMCQAYRDPETDAQVRRNLEVELVMRGQTICNGTNIGMMSVIQMGRTKHIRLEMQSMDGKTCGDFASPAEAQKHFLAKGGPLKDPSMLDPDGDGLACGWGEMLKEVATTAPS